VVGNEHPITATFRNNLASSLSSRGKSAAAAAGEHHALHAKEQRDVGGELENAMLRGWLLIKGEPTEESSVGHAC
jgi:hypothetical protein